MPSLSDLPSDTLAVVFQNLPTWDKVVMHNITTNKAYLLEMLNALRKRARELRLPVPDMTPGGLDSVAYLLRRELLHTSGQRSPLASVEDGLSHVVNGMPRCYCVGCTHCTFRRLIILSCTPLGPADTIRAAKCGCRRGCPPGDWK